MITDRELSEMAGFDANWMAEQKFRNPYKYKVLKRMRPWNYKVYTQNLRNRLGDIYYEIMESDDMTLTEFWRLHLQDLTSSKYSFSVYIRTMAFSNVESMAKLSAVKRMQQIVKRYDKYKERKLHETA